MLRRKLLRDIKLNKSQFITIFLMVMIGVMVYSGIRAYMDGMTNAADNFYTGNNLQDLNVVGTSFTEDDLDKIKSIDGVNDAERKLEITGTSPDGKKTYVVSFIETNNISEFYVFDGEKFDASKSGAWIDKFYADKNDLKVGDEIEIKYDTFTLKEKVLGIINIPDHIYDVKDASELLPNREKFGIVYMSVNELPEDYIKEKVASSMGIADSKMLSKMVKDFDYKDYIPYNYVMVDLKDKKYTKDVTNEIEDNVKNALAIIKIEDTASYSMYEGEIEEGEAFVGIFSGLFLFIALLSVITTMTRVVKNQKLQIGTLKALGFSIRKITNHYIGYGFWVSLVASICGLLLGRFFLGNVFLSMEMSVFEMPNGHAVINYTSYIVAALVVLAVSIITYLTCRRELVKRPAESLRSELPKVNEKSLKLTTRGLFKKLNFSTKWNLRDIFRNKFRTITGIIGVAACSMLIVCAVGMLNSMNNFIDLQFEELYNFKYKLELNENLDDEKIEALTDKYGNATSETLNIEIKDADGNREQNTIFVTDAKDMVRFKDDAENFINIKKDDGVYVTYKLAENNGYELGDEITWHIYGDNTYYTSKIVGFNRDPQTQNVTMTRSYLEKIGLTYEPDALYTNENLKEVKAIENVNLIYDIASLRESMESMLSIMKEMIVMIIFFAILLGTVIIYNMGVLSYTEKQYQFATLKVLGFSDKKIRKVFIKQSNWIAIISIIIGLPVGYYLTSWLFKACLDENFDFGVYILPSTYIIAAVGTFLASYIVSLYLSRKIKSIDMVSSLKSNE